MALIRKFRPRDYGAIVSIHNALYPDHPISVLEKKQFDKIRDNKTLHSRWVAEREGIVVGFGEYFQDVWDYHPQKFEIEILVAEDFQNRGIGSELYNTIEGTIRGYDSITIYSWIKDYHNDGIEFLRKRGFIEKMRVVTSRLDIENVDVSQYLRLEEKLKEEGVVIKTLLELESDPEREEKLYKFDSATAMDVPGNTSIPEFEQWKKELFESPTIFPEGYFVAEQDGKYVGTSNIEKLGRKEAVEIGYTAVRKEYRSRGIAKALKARGILYAKENGYRVLETSNEIHNEPILAINKELGFKRISDWIQYEKIFS